MVTSFSPLLKRNYKGRLDPDADEFIHDIVEGGARMETLVHDLLDYSRVTSQARPLVPIETNTAIEILSSAYRKIHRVETSNHGNNGRKINRPRTGPSSTRGVLQL